MAMNICIEYLWRFFFGLIAYIIKNPIFFLLTLIIVIGIARKFGPLVIGLIATVIDGVKDTLDIGTLGISSPITIFIGVGIGLLWAAMAFSSQIPLLIAIANSIPMFLFGTVLGIAQIPLLSVISGITGFALQKYEISNYLIGIISGIFLYFVLSFTFTILKGFCQGLQYTINLF